MPNTETLQLFFDPLAATGQNGQFTADSNKHRSEVWIDQNGVATTNNALEIKFADQVAVGIQITINLPANWQFANGTCLRIAAALWRNHSRTKANDAIFDSPFVDNNGRVSTVFDQSYTAAQLNGNAGTLAFGTPQLNSGVAHGTDRYLFLVAMILDVLNDVGTALRFTASQDPQMDVGM